MQVTILDYFFIHIFGGKLVKTFYVAFLYTTTSFLKLITAKCAFNFQDRVWFIK